MIESVVQEKHNFPLSKILSFLEWCCSYCNSPCDFCYTLCTGWDPALYGSVTGEGVVVGVASGFSLNRRLLPCLSCW